jgi:DNA transformation protein and related proteins
MREWLEEGLRELPELEVRQMFGGAGIYSEGTMFAILHEGRLYLKTDPQTREAFVQRGSEPFRPRKGSILASYHEVPGEILDDEEQLLAWARRAVVVARAAPSKSRAHTVPPEGILEGYDEEIRALAEELRLLVRAAAPEATEAGYRGWRLIGYRSPHYFCFVAPQKDHVRLGFEHGVRLDDPDGLLEAMGKQVRFVRLLPGQRLPTSALRRLIHAALATLPEPRAAKPRARATKPRARATKSRTG